MGPEVLFGALACGGLCCLTVAAVLLVAVVVLIRTQSNAGGTAMAIDSPGLSADPSLGNLATAQPSRGEPVLSKRSTVIAPYPEAHRPIDGGGPVEEGKPFPRSSGQTIIAFDDEEEW